MNDVGHNIGVVVIGRNEGERLKRCLASLAGKASPIVYVDSGSTDGSAAYARSVGVEVVDLDLSRPFTAARARNEGFARLMQLAPNSEYVQFVDGDCEVYDGWIAAAKGVLDAEPKLAAVCGRRRERYPDATVYNLLCDIEWNTPVGEAGACGGDALMRVAAVRDAGGYDPAVIAAEDDDLCVRMRLKGWAIRRIDRDMTLHDAAMTTAKQWWKRAERSGHAFAQVHQKHKDSAIPHFAREYRSVIAWGGIIPAILLVVSILTLGLGLVLFPLAYGYLAWRVARYMKGRGLASAPAWKYGVHCALAKFPQLQGVTNYWRNRAAKRQSTIIEYKGPAAAAART